VTAVRVRGIYATAITRLLREAGFEVVQASEPIRERFDGELPAEPAAAAVETSRDREGVAVSGEPDAAGRVTDRLAAVGIDSFRWTDPTPRGAVFDGEVRETAGGGATVDLGEGRRGYLAFDDVDGYVDVGDRYRLQVQEPTPPWSDDHPRVRPTLRVETGLCRLSRGRSGVRAAGDDGAAAELVGMTDLLDATAPDGWGLYWHRTAADAGLEAMGAALERAVSRAGALEDALDDAGADTLDDAGADTLDDAGADTLDDAGEPALLAAPETTAWLWFGRESRFALDDVRRAVTATLPGHHRIKAGSGAASTAVDFAEAVCDPGGEFPFGAVAGSFGPAEGDRLALAHGKPDGRLLTLGRGTVTELDADGSLTLERRMGAGGSYDALGTPKEAGDVAVTKLREGRWWYPTTYRDAEGASKGTYVNVCTPVELFSDRARYVDLHVDVIRRPDGEVAVVDEEELAAAVEEGLVSEPLAEKARGVARAVERALSN